MNDTKTEGTTRDVPEVDINETTGLFDRLIEGVVSKALNNIDARMVYGEPVREDGRTVIPVARITTGFGFGGGAGVGQEDDESGISSGEGGGGGGKITASPIGYIEVTPESTSFTPIKDRTAIALRAITLFGGAVFVLALSKALRRQTD